MLNSQFKRREIFYLSLLGASLTSLSACNLLESESSSDDDAPESTANPPTNDPPIEEPVKITPPSGGFRPFVPNVPYDTGEKTSDANTPYVGIGTGNTVKAVDKEDLFQNPLSGIEFNFIANTSTSEKAFCVATDPSRNYLPSFNVLYGTGNALKMSDRNSAEVDTIGNLLRHKGSNLWTSLMTAAVDAQQFVYLGQQSLENLCQCNTPLDTRSAVVCIDNQLYNLMSDYYNLSDSNVTSDLAAALNISTSTKVHAFAKNYFFQEDFPFIYLLTGSNSFFTKNEYPMGELFPIQKGNQWIHSGVATTVTGQEALCDENFACVESGRVKAFYGFDSKGELTFLVGQKDNRQGRIVFTNPPEFSTTYYNDSTGVGEWKKTGTKVEYLDIKNVKGITMQTEFKSIDRDDLVVYNRPYGGCINIKQENTLYQNGVEAATEVAKYWFHRGTGPIKVYREINGSPLGTTYLQSVRRLSPVELAFRNFVQSIHSSDKRQKISLLQSRIFQ